MTEGKIEIPPPIGLLDTDSYSAKANRVTSATSVTTTFEYTITHADGSQVIQIVQDTNGDREVVETKELPATAASKAAKIDIRAAPEVGAPRVPPGKTLWSLALARRRVLGGGAYYCGGGHFLVLVFG